MSTTALWTIELVAQCPRCDAYVDLLEADDFWEYHDFDLAEHGTDRTRNVKVDCPECHKEFEVDCQY